MLRLTVVKPTKTLDLVVAVPVCVAVVRAGLGGIWYDCKAANF